MERCELPSLGPSSIADCDLGLTLSPGSQSQLSASWLHGPDPIPFDLGLGHDFDPFTDFDQLVQQMEGSNKRTSDEALLDEPDSPPRKRQSLGEREPLPIHTVLLHTSPESEAPVSSHTAGDTPTPPASASVQQRFALSSDDPAHHFTLEATVYNNPRPKHFSPYGPTGYHPSAPNLHLGKVKVETSNETAQNRLQNSKRRIDVLTAERNRYRDALLKYTKIDPKNGKLGIQLQEAEIATLRRVSSTQQQRAKQFKTEIQEWEGKYVELAKAHNSLIRDYQKLHQSFTASHSTANISSQSSGIQISYPSPASDSPIDLTDHAARLPDHSSTLVAAPVFAAPLTRLYEGISSLAAANTSTSPGHPQDIPTPISVGSATAPATSGINVSPSDHSPSASPKEVEVVDLTTDDAGAEIVSSQGSPTAQERIPLTTFRRNFRKKELKWLQPANSRAVATNLFNELNPRSRDDVFRVDMGICSQVVETQKQVRRSLGGPFASIVSPTNQLVSLPADDELALLLEAELAGNNDDLACVTGGALGEDYHPTDDELAELLERELAGSS